MSCRRGLGAGRGKGYRNLLGKDPYIHSASAKGVKQPQKLRPSLYGWKDVAPFKRPKFGSVSWQRAMEAQIDAKLARGQKLDDDEMVFIQMQAEHNLHRFNGRGGKDPFTFQCMECGRKFRSPREECPNCGGADIDLYVPSDQERFKHKSGKDAIKGGLADNRPDKDFDMAELKKGINVEMEHTNDPTVAKEIAKDHLTEDKNYYKKLAQIETKPKQPTLVRLPDETSVNELYLFTANDRDLYRQMRDPIEKNLIKKMNKGIYDHDKALKAFQNLVYEASRRYRTQFGTPQDRIFTKADRDEVARQMRDEFEQEQGARQLR